MNRLSPRQFMVVWLCICLVIPVSLARPLVQTPPQTPPAKDDFKFGKADLDLLDQVNIVDRRFDRDGLVYADEATNAYLQRIRESPLPPGLNLENVNLEVSAFPAP